MYFFLKVVHICVGILAMGVGFGLVLRLRYASKRNLEHFALVVKQALLLNWVIVVPALLLQLLLGFSIVGIKGYSLHQFWVYCTFIGYFFLLISWLVSNFFLLDLYDRLRSDNAGEGSRREVIRCFKHYVCAVSVSFLSLMFMLFMMANRIL